MPVERAYSSFCPQESDESDDMLPSIKQIRGAALRLNSSREYRLVTSNWDQIDQQVLPPALGNCGGSLSQSLGHFVEQVVGKYSADKSIMENK